MLVIGMPLAATKNEFSRPRGQSRGGQGGTRFHGPSPLALVEAFFDVPSEQLTALEEHLVTVTVCRGEILVRAGDDADALYLVVSGRFAVEVDGRRVAEVRSGSPIGEIAFFAHGRRTATVTALRDSIVLKLLRADFEALSEEHPAVLKAIAVTLARRLSETLAGGEQPVLSRARTLAVIAAGPEPLPEEFRSRLTRAFSRTSRILVLDAKALAEIFPSEIKCEFEAVTAWLNHQESSHDYLLYFADAELTPFSRKALRQADHILLVGDHSAHAGHASVTLNAVESLAFEIHPSSARRLVLLHKDRASISGTSSWLKCRPVALHHHLTISNDADYDRLIRFISGNAIGFVACGGGALCAAHVGVYKALIDAGISFDLLGGTSGGGAMAAAFAMSASSDDVSRRTADLFQMARALRPLTWPRYSLLDHTVIDRALKAHFGETEIEDLWTGYFAVSTCLANNALNLITGGPVWKAVRATSSIPGLLPPVYYDDGRMLVDGALLDNVPVRSMRTLKCGPNVVVNFGAEAIKSEVVDYAALPSRSQMLLRLLNPFARAPLPNAPTLATVLQRSLMVGRERLADTLEPDDLLVVPPLPRDIGVMDWHRHAELSAIAYDYTAKLIDGLYASGQPIFATHTNRLPMIAH